MFHHILSRYLGLFCTADSVSPLFFSSPPPSPLVLSRLSPCDLLSVSPSVKEVSSVAALIWGDLTVGSGATPFWVSSPAAGVLGADWEVAWVPSASLPEALDEAGLVSEERGKDFKSPGWLGVSVETFWVTKEDVGASDFRLVVVSFPFDCAASLERGRGVEVEVGVEVFFVVPPVFFGWEVLAEEKQKQEKKWEGKGHTTKLFPPQVFQFPPTACRHSGYINKNSHMSVGVKSASIYTKSILVFTVKSNWHIYAFVSAVKNILLIIFVFLKKRGKSICGNNSLPSTPQHRNLTCTVANKPRTESVLTNKSIEE